MSIFPKKPTDQQIPMREFLERIIDERDRLYAARFVAAEVAVAAAFDAQKEAVAAAFLASKEAIGKAENAQTAYNVAHNDLSRKMDEQNKATIPRSETTALFRAADEKVAALQGSYDDKLENLRASFEKSNENISKEIAGLRESRSETSGKSLGVSASWAYLVGGMSVLSVIVSIILHFWK
jgi:phosphopantetheinyl transferase (holo-ACP synthase)